MPWINGRFYINPAYGRVLERARAAEAGRIWSEQYPELGYQTDFKQNSGGAATGSPPIPEQRDADHWVTINGRHVLIHESQAGHAHQKRPAPQPLPESGQASIYADSFEGSKTSNGETFHQDGYTAALLPRTRWHAVPLGTRVELTHGNNSVVVEINDRGAGDNNLQSVRALDLSRAAASALTGSRISDDDDAKMVGLIKLDKIRIVPAETPLGPVPPKPPSAPRGPGGKS